MSCDTFSDFITFTIGRLSITRQDLADSIGISRETLSNWENGNLSRMAMSRSTFAKFDATIRNLNTISKDTGAAFTTREWVDVSQPVRQTIAKHYLDWRTIYVDSLEPVSNEQGRNNEIENLRDSPSPNESLQRAPPITEFKTLGVFAKIIRWKDSFTIAASFEKKVVGMRGIEFEIDVFDEAVLYYHCAIESTNQQRLFVDLQSSGLIEVSTLGSQQLQLDIEAYRRSNGKWVRMYVGLDNESHITFVQRIYNGFQRGNQDLAIKVFNNSTTEVLHLSIDYGAALSHARFGVNPHADYFLSNGEQRPLITYQSEDINLWYASVTNPESDSRLRLSWSFDDSAPDDVAP